MQIAARDTPLRVLALLVLSLALVLPPQAAASSSPTAKKSRPDSPQNIRVIHVTTDSGFDWGDAAIGGAAVLVLLMIVAGGVLVVSNRDRTSSHIRN